MREEEQSLFLGEGERGREKGGSKIFLFGLMRERGVRNVRRERHLQLVGPVMSIIDRFMLFLDSWFR